ncbi:fam-a protein [Plasmodium yoelii]|uniref:Fam-a protein n=1 Tax=Plasmodium yoelii TaxID=5861 RepID=A0A077Y8U1_PLAYE|nr:fam-a protein [Plasmodium yoelii]
MNKFYIKIVFFLLTISLCVNNKTLATDSEEVYEKYKHLLCNDPKETKNACKVMKEALIQLEYHATNIVDYGLYKIYYTDYMRVDNVKYQYNTNVEKKQYIFDDPNMYNKVINKYWDPDSDNFLYIGSVKRKIVRVYNPNLVMIQQRSRKWPWSREKYFYALAAKFEISENKTIIVMTSANINDHNPSNEKYENEIVKSANLFKTDINSEDDIRKGYLKKTFVNIAGYIIEKKDKYLDITHVESIDRYAPSFLKRMIRKALNNFFPQK